MISENVFYYRNDLPKKVRLVAVTKNATVPGIKIAKECGINCFAESRIQDAIQKIKEIPDAEWHFVGHLQTNKVKKAVEHFEVIQSVDSLRLAEKIDKAAKELNKKQKIMIQIKFNSKYGFDPNEVKKAVNRLTKLSNVKLVGVMTMGDKNNPLTHFKKTGEIFKKLNLKYLSMGMTNDYTEALKYGSNMVRIGKGIFD
ncbi:MAG TPA: YggS family pyridoxal phosphate-dependent enzyme [Candidatus Woesearchaeota archaeon]|nr:YggS family pyridoxal phosphate-dependent enzyme [Candidatus Woesearchaeota archaeon]